METQSYKYTAEEIKAIATEINNQISMSTKMAVGYRNGSFHARDGNVTLIFQVTIKAGTKHFINISLEPSDTYRVTLHAVRGANKKIVKEHSNIYCDQLSELIYDMCNK